MLKIKHHEFWNTHLFHLPIYLYWLFLALKARSLFFFSAANPGIETGGLIGESKFSILQKIDPRYLPVTLYFDHASPVQTVVDNIRNSGLQFPFIVKPDIGQGGWLIELIRDEGELREFLKTIRMPFIAQEYVDDPLEFGVLYYRYPDQTSGTISSVAWKELLTVIGDGTSTILQLLNKVPRAKKQITRLQVKKNINLNRIPGFGERVVASFAGNHSYGTTFHNYNHINDAQLTGIFDKVCCGIDGFYFGRFDLRCKSIEALKRGEFKILELNGVGSEPLHIFDPNEKLFNAYSSALSHWDAIYRISKLNRQASMFMNWREAVDVYKKVTRLQEIHTTSFTIGN